MKLFLKILKMSTIFVVSFVLFVITVSFIFGTRSETAPPKILKKSELPMTSPEEWTPRPTKLLARSDRPGVMESRDHRYLGDPYFVFRNFKNFSGFHTLTYNGRQIFKSSVNTDEFGRRCIDDKCSKQNSDCGQIGLFLSSKIFGYGVNNNESLSGHLKEEIPKWNSYNYGILTGNYIQLLTLLKSGELKQHLGDLPSVFVFFWESDGFDRTIPTLSGAAVFERSCYKHDATTGRLEYNGNLAYCHPYRSWLTWAVSNINYFSERFPNFSFFSNSEKVEDFVNSHREIQYEITRQFPKSRYVLAAVNYGASAGVSQHLHELNAHLNLPIIDIDLTSEAEALRKKDIKVDFEPYDHHPTAIMYSVAAKKLKEQLKPYINEISNSSQCNL